MKKSLYQIGQEYQAIAEELEYGEFTPDLEKALAITQNELQNKAINYGFVIKEFENDITTIDEEIKRLQAIKKAKTNAKERIKETISNAMLHYGIEKVEIPTLKLSFRESKSIEVLDLKELPALYKVHKVTESADKKAIKDSIEAGSEVKGAKLVINQNLQIK